MTWLWAMAAFVTVGQANPTGGTNSLDQPTKTAVVDVPAVSAGYLKTKDLEAQLERRNTALLQERNTLREKIERTGRSLQEELKPGTSEFEQRRKQLALYEAEMEWFVDSIGRMLEREVAATLRSIYEDIHAVVRTVAEERGIDVVVAADRLPPDPAQGATQARQQIIMQKVLYWSPRVDLTEEVIARLNASYQREKTNPTPGLAKPPHAEDGESGVENESARKPS